MIIPLSNHPDKFANIDRKDLHLVGGFIWAGTKDRRGVLYATTRIGKKRVSMHRMLFNFPTLLVDHIDGNGLNNRRANLRLVTQSQNVANCRPHHDGSCKFKGVTKDNQGNTKNKWRAIICVNGKKHYLGRYDNPTAAAKAYDTAAQFHFGEFAKLNFK